MSLSVVGSGTVGSMTLAVYPRRFRITATSYGALFGGSTPPLFAFIADLTPYVQDDWIITHQLGQPSRMTFSMLGDIPLQEGLQVRVSLSAIKPGFLNEVANADFGELIFRGNMTEVTTEVRHIGQRPIYQVQAQDSTWALNRLGTVSGTYGSIGFNTLVRQVLADHTYDLDRFTVGFIAQSLGNAPRFVFSNVTVLEALQQIADAAGAFLSITPDRRVNLFQDAAHLTTADSITNTSRNAYALRAYRDLTNIVTQVNLFGRTTQSTGFPSSPYEIAVVDGSIFSPVVNPRILIDNEQLATVGSIAWQPSSVPTADALLYLSAGVVPLSAYSGAVPVQHVAARTIAANSIVQQMTEMTNDRVYSEDNTELTNVELEARADLLIARLSEGYREITFSADDERHNLGRQLQVGQRVAIAITSPVAISQNQTLMVQEVRVEQVGTVANSTVDIRRTAKLGLQQRTQTLDQTLAGTRTTR
jgi:hypothetical protein